MIIIIIIRSDKNNNNNIDSNDSNNDTNIYMISILMVINKSKHDNDASTMRDQKKVIVKTAINDKHNNLNHLVSLIISIIIFIA